MFGGRDNIVLYTEPPTERLRSLPSDREESIRGFIEGFLDSTDDVFDDDGVSENVYRICGIHYNVLAVHGINTNVSTECCIVLEIYRQTNETEYFDDLDVYESDAQEYKTSFEDLDRVIYERWEEQIQHSDDKLLLTET